ncbi:hypothetical protein EVAR_45699_1 [Eumeta japonica]|uniref:Uncharacterized protein n=1 Tax=Eumeta variegata TaxID=151549 RepID=A0A4C1XJD4_EUMVA|nr:hypothetical protein EVAR_45699_1 [Eumeta japonica]
MELRVELAFWEEIEYLMGARADGKLLVTYSTNLTGHLKSTSTRSGLSYQCTEPQFRDSFRFAASEYSNDRPAPVRVATSKQTFKLKLKNYLLQLEHT